MIVVLAQAQRKGAILMARKRERLRRVRRGAGLSQERLAQALGVDTSTVWRWEAGRTEPEAWLRPKLAGVLGVSRAELVELLTGDEGVAPEQPVSATLPADEEQALGASLRHPADSRDRPVVVSVLGPAHTVELLDELVVGLIARYEIEGPQRLVLEARALRRLASSLGSELSGRGERAGLARDCARQSGYSPICR
jgi:transcriptional regulator with XRE-family HTH domain